jgi:5-methyltetrahydropteroyltriglutamate--homocysteine methyltransferase
VKRSDQRILTTHTGSLPRPGGLLELMRARTQGQAIDDAEYDRAVKHAVAESVTQQVAAGVDVVSDGEMGKVAFNSYASERLSGLGGSCQRRPSTEEQLFPDLADYLLPQQGVAGPDYPICVGPLSYHGAANVQRDIDNLKAAVAQARPTEAFLTAASPGTLCSIFGESYYAKYEGYVFAMADAMAHEYRAITDAGLILQLDAPDLVIESHRKFQDLTREQFLGIIELHIEAINRAIEGLPTDLVRLHVCWGNGPRPHTTDLPLKDFIHLLLKAHVGALSVEGSNPRHEHEWRLFESVKLPAGMLLIPGVIDSTTNYVEHPELVAERIVRLARLVGRENVVAGSDCGFGTGAGRGWVAPSVVQAKLQSLAEGAAIASRELFVGAGQAARAV